MELVDDLDDKIVHVVFSSNDYYSPYLGVAIYSLIQNSSCNRKYILYIINNGISIPHIERIKSLSRPNVIIKIIDFKENNQLINIRLLEHISPETLCRLFCGSLFKQQDKVLYLDSDIIINKDVAELYDCDVSKFALGAVRDCNEKYIMQTVSKTYQNTTDYKDMDLSFFENYFNAGVLLINIPRFRELDIQTRGLQILRENPSLTLADQDALNILCRDDVRYFDECWNLLWHIFYKPNWRSCFLTEERKIAVEKAMPTPNIIHYATSIKAWNAPQYQYAEYFWRYARQTDFYEEILLRQNSSDKIFDRYHFPWTLIPAGSRILLYGGGEVGRIFAKQMRLTGYSIVVGVLDKKYQELKEIEFPTYPPEQALNLEYDYLLITVNNEVLANDISHDLIRLGVPQNKIVWRDYKKCSYFNPLKK